MKKTLLIQLSIIALMLSGALSQAHSISPSDNGTTSTIQVSSDNLPPIFTAPLAITIYKDASCEYDASVAITGDVTDEADNYSVGDATFSDVVLDGSCQGELIIERTWSLIDKNGNAAEEQLQIIIVKDLEMPQVVCQNISINLDANGFASIIPNDIDDGSFDNCTANDDLIISASQLDFDISNLGENSIQLTVIDDCGNASTCTAIVTINETKDIHISEVLIKNAGCKSDFGSISIEANEGEGALSYSIDNGESYQSSANFDMLLPDTYVVIVKDENSNIQYYSENPVIIKEAQLSEVFLSVDPYPGPYSINDIVSIQAYAFNAASYSWENSDETNSIIYVTSDQPGIVTYTVNIIDNNGCEYQASIDIEFDDRTAINEYEIEKEIIIKIFPNPNHGEFNLELSGVNDQAVVSIVDFVGRLVLEEKIVVDSDNKYTKHYNLNNYKKGIYILRVTYGDRISYKKVVIQ